MNFNPNKSNCSPLRTPGGIIMTEKYFFPTQSLPRFLIDETETKAEVGAPCELHYGSPVDESRQVLNPKRAVVPITFGDPQDYKYECYPDKKLSDRLGSSASSEMTDQEQEHNSLCFSAAQHEPIIDFPRFKKSLSYIQLDATGSTPSDEIMQKVCHSCSDCSLDSAVESLCKNFEPFDCKWDEISTNGCLNMLLEGTDGFYEQQNRKDQGQDNSTWPMMGSMFFNARTLEVDQHTHLQDGGCQNKSTAFMVSENKRKDSNAGEWICSDVEQSASQRGRDSRKEESPQSAFSTYSDPSLSDREPSAEACKRLKNNAASRRSRACRKQRFQFMQMQVKQLNISNSGLRKSLRELDRLLIEAKEILLQQATKSPNSTVQQDNQTFAYLNMVRSSSFNSETNL